ncbi:glycosyltransferase family A protein [Kocuria palustris]|uniref:glycosyltransferase family A protein n=1 Tax=Kocuria palustris TaxID=71999 RepID=UPI001642AE54|nr:glycosyltransferase family A protein [Kocuria palustris]
MSACAAFVIPTFDDDPVHLQESVAAAAAQEGVEVEIVVVNDGSTRADTLAALAALPEGVARLDQPNSGPSAARNAGIAATTAPWVIPLDADDRLSPDYAARGIAALAAAPECRFAYGFVDRFGVVSERKTPPPSVDLAALAGGNRVGVTAVFRREDWEAVGGYDELLRRGFEDYEFWLRLLAQLGGHGARIDAVHEYRQKPASRRLADLGEGLARTRARVLANNPDHHHVLLAAAWERLDAAAEETQAAWGDRLQLRRWLRPVKRLIRRRSRRACAAMAGRTRKGPRDPQDPGGLGGVSDGG